MLFLMFLLWAVALPNQLLCIAGLPAGGIHHGPTGLFKSTARTSTGRAITSPIFWLAFQETNPELPANINSKPNSPS